MEVGVKPPPVARPLGVDFKAVKSSKSSDVVPNDSEGVRDKVCNCTKKLLQVTRVGQYFGSKSWSVPGVVLSFPCKLFGKITQNKPLMSYPGYHHSATRITPAELRKYVTPAGLNATVHDLNAHWIKPGFELHVFEANLDVKSIPRGIVVHKNFLYDPETGLKAMMAKSKEEVYIVFGAKGCCDHIIEDPKARSKCDSNQLSSAIYNIVGGNPKVCEQACEVVDFLLKAVIVKGRKVILTGQSFGGMLTAYVSLKKQMQGICFNSLPLGVGLQATLGADALAKADQFLVNISVEGDYLSNFLPVNILDQIASTVGLRTPGNFGVRLSFPSAFSCSPVKTHLNFYSSFKKHLGFSEDTPPQDVLK